MNFVKTPVLGLKVRWNNCIPTLGQALHLDRGPIEMFGRSNSKETQLKSDETAQLIDKPYVMRSL